MPNAKFNRIKAEEAYSSYRDPEEVNRLILPALLPADIQHVLNTVTTKELQDGGAEDVYSLVLQTDVAPRYLASMGKGGGGEGVFTKSLNKPDSKYTNMITEGSEEIGLKRLDAYSYTKPGVKQSEIRTLHALRSALGKGEKTNIPLWHSGFRIVVNAPSMNDLYTYQNRVLKDLTEVGRNTLGLVFSNNQCITHKYFLDMVVDLIDSTTLDINMETDDIRDYISMLDLNAIYLGVMSSITVSGLEVNVSCCNVKEVVDGKPKCDYIASVNLDANKLLWVDDEALENWQKKQMLRKTSNSVSVEEVKKYQEKVYSKVKDLNWKLPIDLDARVYFKIPSLTDFIADSNQWVEEITNNVRRSVNNSTSAKEKENIVSAMTFFLRMASYNSFVKRITIEDSSLESRELVLESLGMLNYEYDVVDAFLDSVMGVIEKASIAVVAVPTFTCPNCQSEQTNVHRGDNFQNLIPIAIDTFFFDQVDLVIAGKSTNKKIETDQIRTIS